MSPVKAKVKAIVEFPTPKTRRDVMRFLGMAGFYSGFCPQFSTVAAPLTNLIKRSKKFSWMPECEEGFGSFK